MDGRRRRFPFRIASVTGFHVRYLMYVVWCRVKLSVGMLAAGRASAKIDDLTGALHALKFRLSPLPSPSSFASEKIQDGSTFWYQLNQAVVQTGC